MSQRLKCIYCGDPCFGEHQRYDDKDFCCHSCLSIYQIIQNSGMNEYLTDDAFGSLIKSKNEAENKYEYLDDPKVVNTIIKQYTDRLAKIEIVLPEIHCTSCVWLLENLHRLSPGVNSCKINFLEKKASIVYQSHLVGLKTIVVLLAKLGYHANFNLHDSLQDQAKQSRKNILYKIGIAGFCFGNVMLLSFPEYFGWHDPEMKYIFIILNIALTIPVLMYSARDYFISGYQDIKYQNFSINFPIMLGILSLIVASVYDIWIVGGGGYLDSLVGFVFFLLVGRWFQQVTHHRLDFDNDYTRFFPLSIQVKEGENWKYKNSLDIVAGDTIQIKQHEIIPCDSTLLSNEAMIDYSFVTGESEAIQRLQGDSVYSGGKNIGESMHLTVNKSLEYSQLIQLWKDNVFTSKQDNSTTIKLLNAISKYFTFGIVTMAIFAFVIWIQTDLHVAILSSSSILIIACPCVLVLSVPFLYGNFIREVSEIGIYIKDVYVLERLGNIQSIIFDKTGTLTSINDVDTFFVGIELSEYQKSQIKSLCQNSGHPLSLSITELLKSNYTLKVSKYKEEVGKGLTGLVDGVSCRIGSSQYLNRVNHKQSKNYSEMHIEIDGEYLGYYNIKPKVRSFVKGLLSQLRQKYQLYLLSGDNDGEKGEMIQLFGTNQGLMFNQTPLDKLNFINQLKKKYSCMMIGDGINDAGALKASDVGVVLMESNHQFTPSCDIIFNKNSLQYLELFLIAANRLKTYLHGAIFLALCYNIVGITFGLLGNLNPLTAAILMPISSVTTIIYSVIASKSVANKIKKNIDLKKQIN